VSCQDLFTSNTKKQWQELLRTELNISIHMEDIKCVACMRQTKDGGQLSFFKFKYDKRFWQELGTEGIQQEV